MGCLPNNESTRLDSSPWESHIEVPRSYSICSSRHPDPLATTCTARYNKSKRSEWGSYSSSQLAHRRLYTTVSQTPFLNLHTHTIIIVVEMKFQVRQDLSPDTPLCYVRILTIPVCATQIAEVAALGSFIFNMDDSNQLVKPGGSSDVHLGFLVFKRHTKYKGLFKPRVIPQELIRDPFFTVLFLVVVGNEKHCSFARVLIGKVVTFFEDLAAAFTL